jgi:hypothetical protein
MLCLIDNGPTLRLARRFEGRLSFGGGEVLARIAPLWPTWRTLIEETRNAGPVVPRRRIAAAPREKRRRPFLSPRRERRIQVGRKRLKSRKSRG